MPLSASPGSLFMWSFDRVVAGDAYSSTTVQPVLHRYNDAKYTWDDASSHVWLRGFVRAHGAGPAAEEPPPVAIVDLLVEGTTRDVPIELEADSTVLE